MNTHQDEILLQKTPVTPFYVPDLSHKKEADVQINQEVKALSRASLLLRRLSPFFIVSLLLPVLYTYWFIIEDGLFSKLLLGFKFFSAEAYLMYMDLALWKYYEGKRIIHIWLIELVCILLLTFLF